MSSSFFYGKDPGPRDKWNTLQKEKIPPFYWAMQKITDDVLLSKISKVIQWRYEISKYAEFDDKYYLADQCFNLVIFMGKKWLNMKCKYMQQLIELHEKYSKYTFIHSMIQKQYDRMRLYFGSIIYSMGDYQWKILSRICNLDETEDDYISRFGAVLKMTKGVIIFKIINC